jgi:hypothetical protein
MQEIKKRLILKEDINFDYAGTNETESFFGSDGKNYQGTKFNASHLPLTKEGREKLASANVDQALVFLAGKVDDFSAGDALAEDIEVEINAEDTPDVIQDKINQQKKNLNGHTITFDFPDSLSQQLYSTLVWQDFYNGTIKILGGTGGSPVPVYDKLDITSLFKTYRCQCEVVIENFQFIHQYSLYAVSTESSSSVIVKNCQFSGIKNVDSYAIRKLASSVVILDSELSEDIEFYPPEKEDGIGKHLGEIFAYPGAVPPEGAYLLNGQTIYDCSNLYPDFWEWVNTAGVRIIDNATYEAELSSAGVCGGFVVDTASGSVRLPHIVNGTLWGADSSNVGQSLAAGLPGIDLALRVDIYASNAYSKHLSEYGTEDKGGALPTESPGTDEPMVAMGSASMADRGGDLIKSAIYGNSDTVQPPAIRISWCIQVFNAAPALSEQDSAQLASEMQMKAQTDLGNVMENLDFVVESWESGSNWYRKYRSGWVEQGGVTYTNSAITFPVEFSNASDYCILGTYDENGRGTAISFENRQTTGATVKASWTSDGDNGYTTEAMRLSWYACGKAATK